MTRILTSITAKFLSLFGQDKLIAATFLLLPLLFGGFFLFPTTIHRDILYAFFPLALALLVRDRGEVVASLKEHRVFWGLFFAFLVYMTASVFWSETDEHGRFFQKAKLLFLISLPMLASFHIARKVPDVVHLSILAMIGAAVLTALYLISTGDYFHNGKFIRLHGLGHASNPVQAGFLYALAFLATLSLKAEHKKALILKLAVLAILAVAVGLANSRGAFVALFASLIVYGLIRFRLPFHKMALYGAGIGVVLLAVSALLFSQIQDTSFVQRADTGRLQIWSQATDKIFEAPIFGHGLASKFQYSYTTSFHSTPSFIGHAHNLYLSTAIQGGLIGLTLFLALFGYAAWKAYLLHKEKAVSWPLLFLICGGVLGLSDFGGYVINLSNEWLAFWWPAVFAIALSMPYRSVR